jgi:hypothetical protein
MASARVPAPLLQHTIEASLGSSSLAAPVAELASGVIQTMYAARVKMALVVVVALGLIGSGLGLVAYRTLGSDAEPAAKDTTPLKGPAAGPEVNGLKLALSADKLETFMKFDGTDAEPVKLTLTFNNVGDKPIKFNKGSIWRLRNVSEDAENFARFQIVGPDKDSVQTGERQTRANLGLDTAENMTEIKPGGSWSQTVSFLEDGGPIIYQILKPGEYRIKAAYTGKPLEGFALWTGALTSNEIVLRVKKAEEKKPLAGQAVNGLQLSLSADKTEVTMKADGSDPEPARLKLTFTNVSDQPIKLNTYDFRLSQLRGELRSPDNKIVRIRRGVDRGSMPKPIASDFPVIQPGKTWVYDKLAFPGGVPDGAAMVSVYTMVKPGVHRLRLIYKPLPDQAGEAGQGSWSGEVVSNELQITAKPAEAK